jgi:hypothetical protein
MFSSKLKIIQFTIIITLILHFLLFFAQIFFLKDKGENLRILEVCTKEENDTKYEINDTKYDFKYSPKKFNEYSSFYCFGSMTLKEYLHTPPYENEKLRVCMIRNLCYHKGEFIFYQNPDSKAKWYNLDHIEPPGVKLHNGAPFVSLGILFIKERRSNKELYSKSNRRKNPKRYKIR